VLGYFEERFGIDLSAFDGFILFERPQAFWLLSDSPHLRELAHLRIRTTGIPVLRKIQHRLKPTTSAIQIFGATAVRNVVDLRPEQVLHILKGGGMNLDLPLSSGYVILAQGTHILGCGLYTGTRLLSQIPRSYFPRR
jgi:NOL1/NOP2/fmu family ribosome biogenesis protein